MKRLFLLFLCCLLAGSLFAQRGEPSFIIWGLARDFITSAVQKEVQVTLMDEDSTVISTMNTSENFEMFDQPNVWYFYLSDEEERPHYIVRFEKKGYRTEYLSFDFKRKKRKGEYRTADVKLKQVREQLLGAAEVIASRVKFYTKNDTLVYNADAFQLAEGSMLDALIRQLPGVELKDNGQIFVNGRFVESLLLNGEEFFSKDGSIMLDNLPAYMVKRVNVYEKTDWKTTEKPYVMDVRLKRQYSVGWIANAEAAGGSDDRYLGRLFALRFTPQSRVTAFANLNNINESRKLGQNGEWTPDNMPAGNRTLRQGGLDYLVNDKDGRYKLRGSATVTDNDDQDYTHSSGVNYLQNGNSYHHSTSSSRERSTAWQTHHSFALEKTGSYYYSLTPSFSYKKWRNTGLSRVAQLDGRFDWRNSAEAIDSIFSPYAPLALQRALVNRSQDEELGRGDRLTVGLGSYGLVRLPWDADLIWDASVSHYSNDRKTFRKSLYEYPNAAPAAEDFRHQYDRYRLKETSYAAELRMRDNYWESQLRLEPYVGVKEYFTDYSDFYYRLDRLPDWDRWHPLEQLPSEQSALQAVVDPTNSYDGYRRDQRGYVGTSFHYSPKGVLGLSGWIPLTFRHERQDYLRDRIDTTFYRNSVIFDPKVLLTLRFYDRGAGVYNDVDIEYQGKSDYPSMVTLLDTRSDSNPLRVTLGNPDLKASYKHSVNVKYRLRQEKKSRFLNVMFGYDISRNKVAYGFIYDPLTGIYTYRPENINGNYGLSAGLGYMMPVDRGRKLTFSSQTSWNLYHNVDLMGTTASAQRSTRSSVVTQLTSEQVKLDLNLGKVKVGAKGRISWQNATSERKDFSTVNVFDYQYGATLQWELPLNFQVHTDLNLYSRRGYESAGMNTNDLVWNARVSKTFLDGNLSLILDGFDILNQLSGTSYLINGQGQTETYRNVLPRYIMGHIVYRLNIKPKKRPGDE